MEDTLEKNPDTTDVKVYQNYVFIYSYEKLVTVFKLPNDLRRLATKIAQRLKDEVFEASETETREEAENSMCRVFKVVPEIQEGESTDKAEQGVQGQEQIYSEGEV